MYNTPAMFSAYMSTRFNNENSELKEDINQIQNNSVSYHG